MRDSGWVREDDVLPMLIWFSLKIEMRFARSKVLSRESAMETASVYRKISHLFYYINVGKRHCLYR